MQCREDEVCYASEEHVCPSELQDWSFSEFHASVGSPPSVSLVTKTYRRCKKKGGMLKELARDAFGKTIDSTRNGDCRSTWSVKLSEDNVPLEYGGKVPQEKYVRDSTAGEDVKAICKEIIAEKNGQASVEDHSDSGKPSVCEFFRGDKDTPAWALPKNALDEENIYCKCLKKADASRCIWGCFDDRYQVTCIKDYLQLQEEKQAKLKKDGAWMGESGVGAMTAALSK